MLYISRCDDLGNINLWDAEIKWQNPPSDFVKALQAVAGTAGEDLETEEDDTGLIDFIVYFLKGDFSWEMDSSRSMRPKHPPCPRSKAGIHIAGRDVCTYDEDKASRYYMKSPAPFPMVLPAKVVIQTLTKQNRRLVRIAQYNIKHEIQTIEPGVIFDFGAVRYWIAEHPCKNMAIEDECPITSIKPFPPNPLRLNPVDLAQAFHGESLVYLSGICGIGGAKSLVLHLRSEGAEHFLMHVW